MLLVFDFTRHGGAKKDSERMPGPFILKSQKKRMITHPLAVELMDSSRWPLDE